MPERKLRDTATLRETMPPLDFGGHIAREGGLLADSTFSAHHWDPGITNGEAQRSIQKIKQNHRGAGIAASEDFEVINIEIFGRPITN